MLNLCQWPTGSRLADPHAYTSVGYLPTVRNYAEACGLCQPWAQPDPPEDLLMLRRAFYEGRAEAKARIRAAQARGPKRAREEASAEAGPSTKRSKAAKVEDELESAEDELARLRARLAVLENQ